MSATADSARFSKYFGHAPCIEIPGQAHAVEDFYLEDIMRATRYQAAPIKASRTYTEAENADIRNSFLRQGIEDVQLLSTLTMLTRGERIDYDLVAATAKYLCSVSTVDEAILIFVTGTPKARSINIICADECFSIFRCCRDYTDHASFTASPVWRSN